MSDHENTQPQAKRTRRSGQAKKTNNNGEQTPSLTITPPSVDLIEDENIRQLAAELLANMTPTEYTRPRSAVARSCQRPRPTSRRQHHWSVFLPLRRHQPF